MTSNRVNATLLQGDVDKILAGIAGLRLSLPILIDLTPEERQGMAKFGDKSRGFVAKAVTLVAQHPEILPANFNLKDLQTDAKLIDALDPVRVALEHLLGQVQDTLYAAGSDAYTGALHVYTYAKAANVVTGSLEDALDDMGRRFARHARAAKPQGTDSTH